MKDVIKEMLKIRHEPGSNPTHVYDMLKRRFEHDLKRFLRSIGAKNISVDKYPYFLSGFFKYAGKRYYFNTEDMRLLLPESLYLGMSLREVRDNFSTYCSTWGPVYHVPYTDEFETSFINTINKLRG